MITSVCCAKQNPSSHCFCSIVGRSTVSIVACTILTMASHTGNCVLLLEGHHILTLVTRLTMAPCGRPRWCGGSAARSAARHTASRPLWAQSCSSRSCSAWSCRPEEGEVGSGKRLRVGGVARCWGVTLLVTLLGCVWVTRRRWDETEESGRAGAGAGAGERKRERERGRGRVDRAGGWGWGTLCR